MDGNRILDKLIAELEQGHYEREAVTKLAIPWLVNSFLSDEHGPYLRASLTAISPAMAETIIDKVETFETRVEPFLTAEEIDAMLEAEKRTEQALFSTEIPRIDPQQESVLTASDYERIAGLAEDEWKFETLPIEPKRTKQQIPYSELQ